MVGSSLKDGVKQTIALCHKAVIKVIMVTGAQSLTTESIAYQIGIISDIKDKIEIIQRRENLPILEDEEPNPQSPIPNPQSPIPNNI